MGWPDVMVAEGDRTENDQTAQEESSSCSAEAKVNT